MEIKITNTSLHSGHVLTTCCPQCGRDGTFEGISNINDCFAPPYILGLRRCPNPSCNSYLFFVHSAQLNKLMVTYPALRIDFDKTGIPEQITKYFEEAVTCHAERCYTAAAMLIRRTLEEICGEQGGEGDNLKERIQSLQDKIIIPKELFEGMDELRLLGNDAAHIESKDFENVGKDEVEVGIELTKEILKAVYQYSQLLDKLRSLKKKDG